MSSDTPPLTVEGLLKQLPDYWNVARHRLEKWMQKVAIPRCVVIHLADDAEGWRLWTGFQQTTLLTARRNGSFENDPVLWAYVVQGDAVQPRTIRIHQPKAGNVTGVHAFNIDVPGLTWPQDQTVIDGPALYLNPPAAAPAARR